MLSTTIIRQSQRNLLLCSSSISIVPAFFVRTAQFHQTTARYSDVDIEDPYESNNVKFKKPGLPFKRKLDSKLRLSYNPIYISPAASQVSLAKRVSWATALAGSYITYLLQTRGFPIEIVSAVGLLVTVPIPFIQYFTSPYVSRIFRVYRKDEPQTYENLIKDEKLALEKISISGRNVYMEIVDVETLKVVNKKAGWLNWTAKDKLSGFTQNFYIADDIGGIKMDRIWGIAEHNAGINNGRFMESKE